MLITKFDLYNAEWLDLVFDHRNKTYGAYELRQHYSRNLAKSMMIAFAGMTVLMAVGFLFKTTEVPIIPTHIVEINQFTAIHVQEAKKAENPPSAKHTPAAQHPKPAAVLTTKFVPMVVVPNDPPADPPINNKIAGAVGTESINAPAGGDNIIKPDGKGSGNGGTETGTGNDVSVHSVEGLDVMPQPVGGEDAWNKFLYKNLIFPGVAQDQGISGRVILSFIIEKDGHLSNITVERSAGYGFDEEAIRVLKKAKPWKPGMQNGQPVRVRYMIPINFQMGSN